jgi:hypothetical protein
MDSPCQGTMMRNAQTRDEQVVVHIMGAQLSRSRSLKPATLKAQNRIRLQIAVFLLTVFAVCWVVGMGIAAYLNARDDREMRHRLGTPPPPSRSPVQHVAHVMMILSPPSPITPGLPVTLNALHQK